MLSVGNLEQEMVILRQLVVKYPYVSMVCLPTENGAWLEIATF